MQWACRNIISLLNPLLLLIVSVAAGALGTPSLTCAQTPLLPESQADPASAVEEYHQAGSSPSLDPAARAHNEAIRTSITGTWWASVGRERIQLTFAEDGMFTLGEQAGRFSIENSSLILQTQDGAARYQLTLEDSQLTLSGGSLQQPLVFVRDVTVPYAQTWLFDISPAQAMRTLKRIGVIIIVTAIILLVLAVLRHLSRTVILSDRGWLARYYPRHKHRALTLHSLTLNIIKYIVCFTAFGMILNSLGVNYTAYIASLSVIGLAVGFGSQGLVQDMVTGFFVIFESQYDVDDMVEISGQVGIVQELGLRMTRLRNYQGQTVVIPNRNIAVVGNFLKGAQHANLDVSVRAEQASDARRTIEQIAGELAGQYRGVLLAAPQTLSPMTLPSGETFVRVELMMWPQQQWVIDQQLVPRIKEAFSNNQIEIVGGRLVPFYHAREEVTAHAWNTSLRKRLRWRSRFSRREGEESENT